jgi:hypothetical protein
MEGMSEREYSAHSGLSRGAIKKARKAAQLLEGSHGSEAENARHAAGSPG